MNLMKQLGTFTNTIFSHKNSYARCNPFLNRVQESINECIEIKSTCADMMFSEFANN